MPNNQQSVRVMGMSDRRLSRPPTEHRPSGFSWIAVDEDGNDVDVPPGNHNVAQSPTHICVRARDFATCRHIRAAHPAPGSRPRPWARQQLVGHRQDLRFSPEVRCSLFSPLLQLLHRNCGSSRPHPMQVARGRVSLFSLGPHWSEMYATRPNWCIRATGFTDERHHYGDTLLKSPNRHLNRPGFQVNQEAGPGAHAHHGAALVDALESEVRLRPRLHAICSDIGFSYVEYLVESSLKVPLAQIDEGLRDFHQAMSKRPPPGVTDQPLGLLFTAIQQDTQERSRETITVGTVYIAGDPCIDGRITHRVASNPETVQGIIGVASSYSAANLHRPLNFEGNQTAGESFTASGRELDHYVEVPPLRLRGRASNVEPGMADMANATIIKPLDSICAITARPVAISTGRNHLATASKTGSDFVGALECDPTTLKSQGRRDNSGPWSAQLLNVCFSTS